MTWPRFAGRCRSSRLCPPHRNPQLALEVVQRSGANIETIGMVRVLAERAQELPEWPEGVTVTFQQDKSEQIKTMLSDLENNVVTAIVLVMIVIILAGWRPSLLVGLSIPILLAAMVICTALGFTLNIVVLFSLIWWSACWWTAPL